MARETRRQRRDARRAAGAESPAPTRGNSRVQGTPVPAAGPVEASPVPRERKHRFTFLRESYAELKKVEWPSRAQVIQGTVVVIIACAIVGAYLWGVDQVLRRLVQDVFI